MLVEWTNKVETQRAASKIQNSKKFLVINDFITIHFSLFTFFQQWQKSPFYAEKGDSINFLRFLFNINIHLINC